MNGGMRRDVEYRSSTVQHNEVKGVIESVKIRKTLMKKVMMVLSNCVKRGLGKRKFRKETVI